MKPLSACENDEIQSAVEELLDKSCEIKQVTLTPDGLGSETESLNTVATVACSAIKPTAGLLATYADKIGSLITWQVKMPSATDVRLNDILVIDGTTMIVQAILTPASWSFLQGVIASELQ